MMDRSSNFNRVFFHELGHFVAHIINEKYYGGLGISKFSLTKHGNDYEGEVTPIAIEGWAEETPPPLERLVQTILRLEHGCLFEAYFLQTTLDDSVRMHGKKDYTLRRNMLDYHRKFGFAKELSISMDDYLELLKDRNALDRFLNLNPEEYILLINDREVIIDHEKLKLVLLPLIASYEPFYKAQFGIQENILKIREE